MSGAISCWSCGPLEVSSHFSIRHRVFVEEQGVLVLTDIDARDQDPNTIHAVAARGDAIAGTVRLYRLDDLGRWKGDRLAVLPAHRASLVGVKLVRYAVSTAAAEGGHEMEAIVQVANTAFFQHLGWQCSGAIGTYFGLPHQPMTIDLAKVPLAASHRPVEARLWPETDTANRSPLLVAS
jgi:putative N-acetyltransferase (TIGR04045 family)